MTSTRIRIPESASAHSGFLGKRTLAFRFDSRTLHGYEGDTLASALLANNIGVVGRSFKFHRPRGIFSCGIEEPNALLQIGTGAQSTPAVRATMLALYEGLEATPYGGWPSLRWDVGRALDFTHHLWAAGFYNKTFIWPSWHTYEALIRRMAGTGHAPQQADPQRYDTQNLHCDLLVIGGGITGLLAAHRAAVEGARVILAEQDVMLGGRGAWDGSACQGSPAGVWARATEADLARQKEVRILRRTTAVGYYERDVVSLVESLPIEEVQRGAPRERYYIVRAARVVLATGAIEQPLVFCNNDRPGIVLAGAAHQYLRRYGVAVGQRVVVATNNDSAYLLAHDLKEAGVEVLAVADTRRNVSSQLEEGLRAQSVRLLPGWMPIETRGFSELTEVTLGRLSQDQRQIETTEQLRCDALATSGGWAAALHLYSHASGRLAFSDKSQALEGLSVHPVASLASAASQGAIPGIRHSPVGNTARQWVDLRHDVTVSDLELAVRENFSALEHVKRYTTVGMSLDQGKTSNLAALEIIASLRGVPPSSLGHTTLRPPFTPVTLGAIAGRSLAERFAPCRRTPLNNWHLANGGVLEDFGEWKRPAVYLRPGESRHAAVLREARAVREAVGLFDASSLGKIEVHGPDALAFADRFYINDLSSLRQGQIRYGLMLRESGVILDDGTVTLLAPDHLLITTTSSNGGRIASWLQEWHQCEWPQLQVAVTLVTDQWATVSLAGARAREWLNHLPCDIDLSPCVFAHLCLRTGHLLGHPARIARVSYTGELAYEISVPSGYAEELWATLMAAGARYGVQPFGIEALQSLRVEKGFLHVGADTDGTTVPQDVGFGKVARNKSGDFIGKRSLFLPEHMRSDRLELVGLIGESRLVAGSHLRAPHSSERTDGWVTSATHSIATGEPIALAVLRGGRGRLDTRVAVHDVGTVTSARVVALPFYDRTGSRMRA